MRGIRLALIIIVLISGVDAHAQTGSLEDLRVLSLEELMNAEVISSTQQQVRLQDAPSTSYVITGEQIRKWGIRRLSELVDRLVPGAFGAEDADDVILAFRGVTADNNLKVLLLLNGHEYNTQWNNGPSSELELGLMEDIRKVEVLVGPHSALYGSGALLAVINIITRSGQDFSGVRVSGAYGSGDYKKGEIIAGGQQSNDLDYFFSMGGMTADGFENNNNAPLNISRFPPSWRFYGNVNYKEFELMTRFTRSSRAFYAQPASQTAPNVWTNYDTFFVDMRRRVLFNDDFNGVFNVNYDTIQTQRHDFTIGTKLRAVGEDRISFKFTGFYKGLENNKIVLGAYYRRDEFGDDWEGDNVNFFTSLVNGAVTGVPADPYLKRTLTPFGRNAYALFVQDSIEFGRKSTLLLGLRYDRIEAPQIRKPDSFTPRVAFVYRPSPETALKAMFTTGLSRQPNAAVVGPDNFAFGTPVITNFEKPERLTSFELAGSWQIRPDVDLQVNFFYNSLQDLFGLNPNVRSPATPVLITAGRIDYTGIETIATVSIGDRAFLRGAHQYVRFGSEVNDVLGILTTPDMEHPFNYPENLTKLLIDYRFNKDLSANANANVVWNNYGITPDRMSVESGAYVLLNANFIWNLRPHVQLILSGYNLFDQQNRIPLFGNQAYIAERNFLVNCGYRF